MSSHPSTSSLSELTWSETLLLRQKFLPKACSLHFDKNPLKMVRAKHQYMYDDLGQEYLDCISNVSHVGHCHPDVIKAGEKQMTNLFSSAGGLSSNLKKYPSHLLQTLPDCFDICFFVNSGSEANDVALQLARAYTEHEDVVVIDHAFHGCLGTLTEISPREFRRSSQARKEYVHVVPLPDLYYGVYKEDEPQAAEKYFKDVKKIVVQAISKGRQIACFISEPIFTCAGIVFPPQKYLNKVYEFIHSIGGICIADETQTSLGRIGSNYWGFQSQDAIPDIITVGKPLGNGYPMATVITRKEVASALPHLPRMLLPNPVAFAIGKSILEILEKEKYTENAILVGDIFLSGLNDIMNRHENIGHVKGAGLLIGIDIVKDKSSRKPYPELAEKIVYRLKDEFILITNDGQFRNVLCIFPPLCFTCDNALTVIQTLDNVLTEFENENIRELGHSEVPSMFPYIPRQSITIPFDVMTSGDEGKSSAENDSEEPALKRFCNYSDID